jgi:16S rRNA (guanine1516-N2)-methyltransferase
VCDATAGLGEDAWLLAAAGCHVTACERQPIIHALLDDGLRRARLTDPDTADRIDLLPCGDAREVLAPPRPASEPSQTQPQFEVVLLDPMFPGAGSRKTLERKALRVLRLLAGDDQDAAELFPAAKQAASHRVVVKRPAHAPPLGDRPPASQHPGRGFRFDVYPVKLG